MAVWLGLVDFFRRHDLFRGVEYQIAFKWPAAAAYAIVPTLVIGAGDLSRRTLAARGVSWRVQKQHKADLEQARARLPTMRAARGIGKLYCTRQRARFGLDRVALHRVGDNACLKQNGHVNDLAWGDSSVRIAYAQVLCSAGTMQLQQHGSRCCRMGLWLGLV